MPAYQPDWRVLLIGGSSGAGKTVIAKALGLHFGVPWLQVDDLRLALQSSHVMLPEDTDALYFFTQTRDVWQLPSERLCEGLIAVGRIMTPAIEVVIANHIDTFAPIIIEGDGILPSLLARPDVQTRANNGQVQAVFLIEPDEEILLANMAARGRGIDQFTREEQCTEARSKRLYGQWLAAEAHRYNLPILESRPWTTLVERIIAATSTRA